MDSPVVSIIVPCYNVERYVKDFYLNISQSSFQKFELIFVNDGSTDNTAREIDDISDSRVVLVNKTNGGVSSARNAGISIAKGEYILFFDPDDMISERLMDEVVKSAINNSSDLVVFGFQTHFMEGDMIIEKKDYYPKADYNYNENRIIIKDLFGRIIGISDAALKQWIAGGNLQSEKEWGTVWRFLFKKKIILDNNVRFNTNLKLNEDSMFVCNYLLYINTVSCVNELLYYYKSKKSGAMYTLIKHGNIVENKLALVEERSKLRQYLKQEKNIDIQYMYLGTLILSVYEIAVALVDKEPLIKGYKKFCKYVKCDEVKEAIEKAPYGRKVTYMLPTLLLKTGCNSLLFLLFKLAKILNVKIVV